MMTQIQYIRFSHQGIQIRLQIHVTSNHNDESMCHHVVIKPNYKLYDKKKKKKLDQKDKDGVALMNSC